MQNFEKLINLLVKNNVKFILIGGFAAVVHGGSILTQDIDVCISFDEKNTEKLLNALKNIHPIHRDNKKTLTESAKTLSKYKNLYLVTDLGVIDLLGQVIGLGAYGDLLNHTIKIDLFGNECMVLDIDSLIRSKEFMDRPKDQEVIIQLKAIKERMSSGL